MTESLELIQSRIGKIERERADALAKAKEYENKAAVAYEKATELEVHLRYLKQWTTEYGQPPNQVHEARPEKYDSTARGYIRPTAPLRAVIKECLARMHDFRAGELISAVQAIKPNAKESSIRAELSHIKARGDVLLLEKDFYRSILFVENKKAEFEMGEEKTNRQGETNEPKSGFGRIAE